MSTIATESQSLNVAQDIAHDVAQDVSRAMPQVSQRRMVRWSLAALGVLCVGLGGAGVLVPGLPTTVFLIIATWCFAKSCPWLEDTLVRNRFFGPFLKYVDGREAMPIKAKIVSIGMMWAFAGGSAVYLALNENVPVFVPATVVAAAGAGTWWIARRRVSCAAAC